MLYLLGGLELNWSDFVYGIMQTVWQMTSKIITIKDKPPILLQTIKTGAPPKHQVLEHQLLNNQLLKHQHLKHQLSKTSTV
jgi:hypothetical protein